MYWLPVVILGLVVIFLKVIYKKEWKIPLIIILVSAILTSSTVAIDYHLQTDDQEVWSGRITDVSHKDAWDEWIPPSTSCTTDSKGNQSCTTTAGYYEHHPAENEVQTSDNGWTEVYRTPNGLVINDDFPRSRDELLKYFPIGTPTASVHTYENKVQASYSIFKHKGIDPSQYPDLPDYPKQVTSYFNVDRIIGYVPNKQIALQHLADINSDLNKSIPDPENQGKMRSWKEVNLIFVNVGANKPEDYGYALQDKWKGGNKNDFVVSFSMDNQGNIAWVYPFSWSESELLKLHVRDYMMNLKKMINFVSVEDEVSKMVANEFVRKQFVDFNYLQIDITTTAWVIIWVLNILLILFYVWMEVIGDGKYKSRNVRYRRRY